jgi:hypothetical protein
MFFWGFTIKARDYSMFAVQGIYDEGTVTIKELAVLLRETS